MIISVPLKRKQIIPQILHKDGDTLDDAQMCIETNLLGIEDKSRIDQQ